MTSTAVTFGTWGPASSSSLSLPSLWPLLVCFSISTSAPMSASASSGHTAVPSSTVHDPQGWPLLGYQNFLHTPSPPSVEIVSSQLRSSLLSCTRSTRPRLRIPAMQTTIERLFLAGGNVVSNNRVSVQSEHMQALIVLYKSLKWLSNFNCGFVMLSLCVAAAYFPVIK